MASGYTDAVKNGSFSIRFYWTSSYSPTLNSSTVNVTVQIYNTTTWGGNLYACGYALSGAGVYLNGSLNYAFDGTWGTNGNLECSANVNSWTNMSPRSSYISPITVQHDANGNGTFTVRFYGTIVPGNHESTHTSIDTGTQTISIHEDAPYSITYNANGGSGAPSSRGVYYGISYNLSSTRPTRTGYTFLGWSASSTATTATYQPGDSVTISGNLALYAVWVKNSYTLTINVDAGSDVHVLRNGEELFNGDTIHYDEVLNLSIRPKTGYEIKSRFPEEDTIIVTGNLTIVCVTSPMATIHRRQNGAWAMYLIYKRHNSTWQLYQANIRQNGLWQKYF